MSETKINANQTDITAKSLGALESKTTLPTASATELGNIYQFTGTTDANYTNGYFYKCVSDGQDPATYSWEQTDVQPQAGGLPTQTGNSGKFLTTDGADASWGYSVGDDTTGRINLSPNSAYIANINYTHPSLTVGAASIALDRRSGLSAVTIRSDNQKNKYTAWTFRQSDLSPYDSSFTPTIGAQYPIDTMYLKKVNPGLGGYGRLYYFSFIGGTIATQMSSQGMPNLNTQAVDYYANSIVQCSGGTDSNFTVGYFYKAVKDGTSAGHWERIDVQPRELPDTTGLADGNYRLRLTMASGVPTLSWVAE